MNTTTVITVIVSASTALIVGVLSFVATWQQTRIMKKQFEMMRATEASDAARFLESAKFEEERFEALQGTTEEQVQQLHAQVVETRRQTERLTQAQYSIFERQRRWEVIRSILDTAGEILWIGQLERALTSREVYDFRRDWSMVVKRLELALPREFAHQLSGVLFAYLDSLARFVDGDLTKADVEKTRIRAVHEFSMVREQALRELGVYR